MSDAERIDFENTIQQLRSDRDRWMRTGEILADGLSLLVQGDFEGAREILEQAYEEAAPNV